MNPTLLQLQEAARELAREAKYLSTTRTLGLESFLDEEIKLAFEAGARACGDEIARYCPRSTERVTKFLTSLTSSE